MLDKASRTGVLRLAERMIHHSHAHDSLARCEPMLHTYRSKYVSSDANASHPVEGRCLPK